MLNSSPPVIVSIVKPMPLISSAEASYFHFKSLKSDFKERARLFPLALKLYETALQTYPQSTEILLQFGNALVDQALRDTPKPPDYRLLRRAVANFINAQATEAVKDALGRVLASEEVANAHRGGLASPRMQMVARSGGFGTHRPHLSALTDTIH